MGSKPNRHVDASTLTCQPSSCGYQRQYWQRLSMLSQLERQDYLKIYDALAKAKRVTPLVEMLLDREVLSERVFNLASELTSLIERMTLARLHRNVSVYRQLHATLDDINIAVNAWLNPICLKHSAFLYGRYRQLQQAARYSQPN